MKQFTLVFFLFCASLCLLSLTIEAQQPIPAKRVLREAGHTGVVIVKSAARVTWAATKITVRYGLKPAAKYVIKPIVVQAVPRAGLFVLKTAGKSAKRAIPAAGRLSLLLLKTRLPL